MQALLRCICNCCRESQTSQYFFFVKSTLSHLQIQSTQGELARLSIQKVAIDCHDNVSLISGNIFFITVELYTPTQIGIEKGMSAGGHITLRKEKDQ